MSERKWKIKDRGYSKCDVRLTREEDGMLQELSERNGVTRSEIMRKALDDFYKWNSPDETKE